MDITIRVSAEEIEAVARLFTRAIAPASPEPSEALADQPKTRMFVKTTSVPLAEPAPITLAPGNVDWRVEIDGIPVHWQLSSPAGKFPAARGQVVIWQGQCYRVTHLYGTSLKVISQDADTYQAQNGAVTEVPG